jgi:DNA-binding XRE family transcriptional regulator
MTANPDETLDHRVPTPADLAEIVKVMRATNKWSQATLAELARVTERTVQRVENGEPSSLDTRRALAGAFRCQDLDVFERPWPFPNVDKLADLEQTTVAISLTRIRDSRTVRTMVEGAHSSAIHEIGELSSQAREAFAEIVDYLRDYNDIRDEYSMGQRLGVDRDIDALLKSLSDQRAALGAGLFSTKLKWRGVPDRPAMDWTNIYFVLAPEDALPSTVRVPRSIGFG